MATRTPKTREQRIKAEYRRLRRTFADMDKNKLAAVNSLMLNAATMSVWLEDLQGIINAEGFVTEYQNGEHQKGTKQSEAVKAHISMTRNHTAAIKQLADLCPPVKVEEDELQILRGE